ncbi:MAG: beta-glucuronidase [Alicyclobacillus sp.]|nr:beta-glucuronidase [Alicyclobacillus sp.]
MAVETGRLFATHYIRKSVDLNSIWDFSTVDEKGARLDTMKMVVPSCWEIHPKLASYRGQAVYSKRIRCGGNVRFVFKGISHTSNIYFDGKHIGYHYNAYTPFDVLLTNVDYGEHLLEVHVDNSFHAASALHVENNDYYSYGGITRPVLMEQLEDIYIRQIHFTPTKREADTWCAELETVLVNLSDNYRTVRLGVQIGESYTTYLDKIVLQPNSKYHLMTKHSIAHVQEWSPENPNLYYLRVVVYDENDNPIDDLIDRIGFRIVSVEGDKILLNGQRLLLKGFNRHEDYAEFGCSLPLQAMYRDIEILKDLGANCIRTSHYPNDERFLDLCDEYGILVWEESHARGLSEAQMRHENFEEQSEACIREMIEAHFNHPCIFTWGILNECASDTDYGRSCYEKQVALIRELDNSRPVTSASCHFGTDKCLDLFDIVSFNIYPGWYFDESPEEHLHRLQEWIATTPGRGKPLIISEIGADAIYGFRSVNKSKWTEEFQEEILGEQLNAVLKNDACSGVFVWQFADCRVDNGSFYARPKCQNNKGVVDVYRRPKLSYKRVKEIFERCEVWKSESVGGGSWGKPVESA